MFRSQVRSCLQFRNFCMPADGATKVVLQAGATFSLTQVNRCLSIKGAEDTINKPYAFEISTIDDSMFFIADSEKVGSALLICSPPLLRTSVQLMVSRVIQFAILHAFPKPSFAALNGIPFDLSVRHHSSSCGELSHGRA